jgi:predicted nucleic acid-binding Zn ribbon protein
MFHLKRRQGTTGVPVPIGQSLQRLIADMGIGERLLEQRAMLLWDEVVGLEIAQAARPDRMARGNLHVRVKTATWRHTLLFHREEIRRKLNDRLGKETVRQIVLK